MDKVLERSWKTADCAVKKVAHPKGPISWARGLEMLQNWSHYASIWSIIGLWWPMKNVKSTLDWDHSTGLIAGQFSINFKVWRLVASLLSLTVCVHQRLCDERAFRSLMGRLGLSTHCLHFKNRCCCVCGRWCVQTFNTIVLSAWQTCWLNSVEFWTLNLKKGELLAKPFW